MVPVHSLFIFGTKKRCLFCLHLPLISENYIFSIILFGHLTLGACFNALSLVTLVWIAAFTLPKIYLNNQVLGEGGGGGFLLYLCQSWARDNFIASQQRQRDNIIEPQCTVILTFYTAANVHSKAKQLLRLIHPSLAHRKSFHEKPSERYHLANVFMLGQTGTNELQMGR